MTGERGSPGGADFENVVLIARQRPGKSASPSDKVHRQCMWFGRTTQPSTVKRSADARLTDGVAQHDDARHQWVRPAVDQVDREGGHASPGTRFRRYSSIGGVCPAVENGGMRYAVPPYAC